MALLTVFRHRFYKNDGSLNAGGKVYTYVAGTSTPVATYTDSTAATPNTNPIILDSKGEADIWVASQIKVNVLESDDTQVTGWPVDNIGSGVSSTDVSMRYSGVASGTANALTISPSPSITAYAIGQTFLFKAGASDNSGATTIAISGLAPIAAQSNGSACVGGEIVANYWYTGLIDTLTTCQIVSAGAEGGKVALTGNQTIAGVKTFSDKTSFSSGTVSAPGIYLSTDTTTGLYRIGANNDGYAVSGAKVLDIASTGLGITGTLSATGNVTLGDAATDTLNVGNGGLVKDASGNVGIGIATPDNVLHVHKGSAGVVSGIASAPLVVENSTTTYVQVLAADSGTAGICFGSPSDSFGATVGWLHDDNLMTVGTQNAGDSIVIATGENTEALRIDSAQTVIINAGAARTVGDGSVTPVMQLEGTNINKVSLSIIRNSNDASGSRIYLGKSRSTTVGGSAIVQADDVLGTISFLAADGGDVHTVAATIVSAVDGTPGVNDIPGRLVFSTTVDGSNTPTERMRIDNAGNVLVTSTGGLGYGTGSGGAVTQITSRTTGVTLNTTNGSITLVSAAGSTSWQTFTVTNSKVASTDIVYACLKDGTTDSYEIHTTSANGSFRVAFKTTGGTTTEQPVFNFAVIKGVVA